jgi:hypothetical protein
MTNDKKTPAARRIYFVAGPDKARLVNAPSASQAIVHAFKPLCRVATQSDLLTLTKEGVEVEDAA